MAGRARAPDSQPPTAVVLGADNGREREIRERISTWEWRDPARRAGHVDLVVICDGRFDEAELIKAFRMGHEHTRVVPEEALEDLATGGDWWRGRKGLAKLRAATKGNRNMRVAKYIALALQPAFRFRWPSVDALDVLHAVRISGPTKHESELRRLGYRWDEPAERRYDVLRQTVDESELRYVADLLVFVITMAEAREARPVRPEVVDTYRSDHEWLRREFEDQDMPFVWPTV